jgi:putative Mn2+ efflux pump MntP
MGFTTLLIIAIGLSFDSFAVSVSSGIIKNTIPFFDAVKIALSLAFFQGTMPLLGWFLGKRVSDSISEYGPWIAFGLLGILGARMIMTSLRQKPEAKTINPLHPMVLLSLSIATSVDALIVGISFAFFELELMIAILLIGSITFLASMLGILFGKNIGNRYGKKMEILGGLVLISIGLKILLENLIIQ